MKKFVFKLLIIICLIAGVDFIVGSVFSKLYFKVKSGTIYTTNHALKDCMEDILLLGASETSHHLISNTIRDSLGLTCYNMGMDGLNMVYQYAIFQETIKRYTPKIIVISTNSIADNNKTHNASIKSLLPYCKSFSDIKSLVVKADPVEQYKLISRSYPYNSSLIKIIQGIFLNEPETNGYKPLNGPGINLKLRTSSFDIETSPETIDYFSKFVALAQKKGIRVYLFQSPRYQINSSLTDQLLFTKLAEKHDLTILSYITDTTFINHPEYFKDRVHLNNTGAEILTSKFIGDLKKENVGNDVSTK